MSVGTGAKGTSSPRGGFPLRGTLQRSIGRVQHRQVREGEAQDDPGGGRHARVRHPGAAQELQEPLRVSRHHYRKAALVRSSTC
jgi:hypothetical protein